MSGAGFGGFVRRAHDAGRLVVQPRMGMSSPQRMRAGLLATRPPEQRSGPVEKIDLDDTTGWDEDQ